MFKNTKNNCIGQESAPGLPHTANLLLLAGKNFTTEPPMLSFSCKRAIRVVKYVYQPDFFKPLITNNQSQSTANRTLIIF